MSVDVDTCDVYVLKWWTREIKLFKKYIYIYKERERYNISFCERRKLEEELLSLSPFSDQARTRSRYLIIKWVKKRKKKGKKMQKKKKIYIYILIIYIISRNDERALNVIIRGEEKRNKKTDNKQIYLSASIRPKQRNVLYFSKKRNEILASNLIALLCYGEGRGGAGRRGGKEKKMLSRHFFTLILYIYIRGVWVAFENSSRVKIPISNRFPKNFNRYDLFEYIYTFVIEALMKLRMNLRTNRRSIYIYICIYVYTEMGIVCNFDQFVLMKWKLLSVQKQGKTKVRII